MKRYEKYKDSGVKWLGEVPDHWEVKRFASYFQERRQKVSDKDFEPLSVTKNGIMPQLANAAKSNDGDNRKLVKKGDFVINSRSDRKGSSGVSPIDGSVSLINIVLEPSDIEPAFCSYLLKSYAFIEEYYRVGRGIVADLWTTRYDEMKLISLATPQKSEQKAIAEFLDDKTAKIDQAISIKEKEIELLKERRQILIQKAVTKGLELNVKMKDSGVDWIGEIPEHWEVRKLKYVFDFIRTGTTPPTGNQNYFDGEINWFNPKDLNEGILVEAEKKISNFAISQKEIKMFPGDSILIVGIGATSGKTAYLVNNATFNQQITGFHSITENNKFYYYFMKCATTLMLNLANYTTLPILNNEFFKSFLTIVPPINEQIQIVTYIEEKDEKISKAILLKQQEMEKLKEYKTVLIDNVVTGKIKVC